MPIRCSHVNARFTEYPENITTTTILNIKFQSTTSLRRKASKYAPTQLVGRKLAGPIHTNLEELDQRKRMMRSSWLGKISDKNHMDPLG